MISCWCVFLSMPPIAHPHPIFPSPHIYLPPNPCQRSFLCPTHMASLGPSRSRFAPLSPFFLLFLFKTSGPLLCDACPLSAAAVSLRRQLEAGWAQGLLVVPCRWR